LSGIGGELRPGIVHRLDRGTSGLMVVAKHDRAHQELTRQFTDREVERSTSRSSGASCTPADGSKTPSAAIP
jgi:hypothetical protein